MTTEQIETPAPAPTDETLVAGAAPAEGTAPVEGEPGHLISTGENTPAPEWEPYEVTDLALPEGIELDEEHSAILATVATENKIPKAALETLLGEHGKQMAAVAEKLRAEVEAGYSEQLDAWRKTTIETYGGMDNVNKALARIEPIITEFGGKELREALTVTGMSNNPAFFAFVDKVANAIGERPPLSGGNVAPEVNPLHRMYPTMVKET